jgi:hypothetical protein
MIYNMNSNLDIYGIVTRTIIYSAYVQGLAREVFQYLPLPLSIKLRGITFTDAADKDFIYFAHLP